MDDDPSPKVIPLRSRRGKRLSLADLMAAANQVPADAVAAILAQKFRALADAPLGQAPPAVMREMFTAGALLNRLLFEIHQIPKDPSFLI